MNSQDHTPDPRLAGLRGKPRRAEHLRLRAVDNAERRAHRRQPTPHAVIIAELRRACLLPAPGPDISESERRGVRNKLKAMRRAGR